ncbi:MAG: hypothetical protein PHV32_16315 [Eubacteriales bacterium]|nr:hypothetical protein [Eubacteriales bacterium]
METTQNTALQVLPNISEIQKIIGDAPKTLVANITSRDRALKAADELIAAHKNVGMTPQLDGQMASYVEKGKKTLTALNEKRKPFTQMMDELKKKFTGCESDIKGKIEEVQKLRDDYAAELIKQRQEQERQAALKAAKEKEHIFLVQQVKDKVVIAFYDFVAKKKEEASNFFNSITLETYEAKSTALETSPLSFTPAQLKSLQINLTAEHHTPEEIQTLIDSILDDDNVHLHYASEYESAMSIHKQNLIDRLPSLKKELEALAVAGEQEKARIQQEQARRQQQEQEKAKAEAESLAQEQALKNKAEAAQAEAASSMDIMFSTASSPAPRVKESIEIVIKNNAAYALLFQYWFERKGKEMDQPAIERMTIERIRKFCEDYISKTGEVIESPYLEIKEKYKAK